MTPEYAELVAAVSFGVLSAIFVSAFVILIIICRRQRIFYKATYLETQLIRSDRKLIEPDRPELELGEVNSSFEEILSDEQWVDDATGLIPHCLSILKTCRYLTERLTALAMNTTPASGNFSQFVDSARRISGRVDDLVKGMYPPLDPRLLEARATALTLAVTHLALIAKYECGRKDKSDLDWIDRSLTEMDSHIMFLREASLSQEAANKLHPVRLSTTVIG